MIRLTSNPKRLHHHRVISWTTAAHKRLHTRTQNSLVTSEISCHTSQLCAREVGMTNHPPLRIEPALKTTENAAHSLHKQHTTSTQQFTHTIHKQHTSLVIYSGAPSWDLWDRPIPLPLHHSDRRYQPSYRQFIQLGFLYPHVKGSSFGSHFIRYSIRRFFIGIQATPVTTTSLQQQG